MGSFHFQFHIYLTFFFMNLKKKKKNCVVHKFCSCGIQSCGLDSLVSDQQHAPAVPADHKVGLVLVRLRKLPFLRLLWGTENNHHNLTAVRKLLSHCAGVSIFCTINSTDNNNHNLTAVRELSH